MSVTGAPSVSRGRDAFSLIEIVLALGIIAFALIGILGLFPVAVKAAAESQQQTQATLIARSIFDQLEATAGTEPRRIALDEKYDGTSPSPLAVDLTKPSTSPLIISYDADAKSLSANKESSAPYTAQITVTPIVTPNYGLSQVLVTVESKTASYPFTSILRQ
jgi:type II secretory pathway pseudopilin PulG